MLTLGDIMADTVYRVDADTSIRDTARIMDSRGVGSVAVTKAHQIQGIVTESDMVRRVLARDLNPDTHTVEEIMTSPLITADASTGILDARDIMDRKGVRHLLVSDGGEIRGIVSVRDLIHKPALG
ncbi:MAG: cyclic nucleotide-binding/CBS domain-containing protein [Leptospirillia bacterium]